jgi:hypothetical protein
MQVVEQLRYVPWRDSHDCFCLLSTVQCSLKRGYGGPDNWK